MFAAILALWAMVRARRAAALLSCSVPVVAVAALVVLQWRVSERLLGTNMQRIGSDFGDDPLTRMAMLPGALFGGLGAARQWILGILCLTALVGSAVAHGRGRVRRFPLRVALWRYRYAVLGLVFFLLFLVFPMSVRGTTLLAHRFLPIACACVVVACAAPSPDLLRTGLFALIPVAVVAVQIQTYIRTDRDHRSLDKILAYLPMNKAVAQLDLTPMRPGRVAPVPGPAGRVLAERGGRMLFAFTDMPPNPVYLRSDSQWIEPMLRLAPSPYAFVPEHDGTRFSYLLTLNRRANLRPLVRKALEPEFVLVTAHGDWDLYRSTLVTVPLDAPNGPPPSAARDVLATRVKRIRLEMRP